MIVIKHALIMAAGRGSRMMPLTDSIPKAMAGFKDSTLIASSIGKLKPIVENIHITVGYKGADLAKHVIEQDVNSIFNTEGKGNSWWVFNTLLKNIDEPILLLTCDNIVELDLDSIYKNYISFGSPACMVVPVKPVEGLEGDFIWQEKNCIVELNRTKVSDCYCSGIQLINPAKVNRLIPACEDFGELWKNLIEKKELFCSDIYPSTWFSVDTLAQLAFVNNLH